MPRAKQLSWLFGIWMLNVVALGMVGGAIRWVLL